MLEYWLVRKPENEHLEFKEAKNQYNTEKLMKYCVALTNEGGGHLILGVSDKLPRHVVNTETFPNLADIKARILDQVHFRVDITELFHPDGRVLIFDIPSRPIGHPVHFEGTYLMRTGEALVPMTQDQLRRIFSEGNPNWFMKANTAGISGNDVISLLDTQAYFDLIKQPYPTTQEGVLTRLSGEKLITAKDNGWVITNLAAILLAKRLDAFSPELARKASRIVIYDGLNKLDDFILPTIHNI